MDASGSNVTRVTEGPAEDRDPAWAPDGTVIGFVRNRDIYVTDPDGDAVTNITGDGAGYSDLAWQAIGSSSR